MSRGRPIIFVGNLPGDVRERELEDLFAKVRVSVDVFIRERGRAPVAPSSMLGACAPIGVMHCVPRLF